MKKCSKCKVEKDESLFHMNKSGKYGLAHYCKSCTKEYSNEPTRKEWRKKYDEKRYQSPEYRAFQRSEPRREKNRYYKNSESKVIVRRRRKLKLTTDVQ